MTEDAGAKRCPRIGNGLYKLGRNLNPLSTRIIDRRIDACQGICSTCARSIPLRGHGRPTWTTMQQNVCKTIRTPTTEEQIKLPSSNPATQCGPSFLGPAEVPYYRSEAYSRGVLVQPNQRVRAVRELAVQWSVAPDLERSSIGGDALD